MVNLSPIERHLNFYRIHLLAFIVLPLLWAVVFWACNGAFPVAFIDSLYVCISAATGTGLLTLDLSGLTAWQQVLIVLIEIVGNQAFVAWVVVVVRRSYFRQRLRHIVEAEMKRTSTIEHSQDVPSSTRHIRETLKRLKFKQEEMERASRENSKLPQAPKSVVRADMIRRLDVAPRPIDPMASMPTPSPLTADTSPRQQGSTWPTAPSVGARSPQAQDTSLPGPACRQRRFLRGQLRRVSERGRARLETPAPGRSSRGPQATAHAHDARAETLVPTGGGAALTPEGPVKSVPYLSFSATVRRNSAFYGLTAENIEELGGVEYRALSALLWIIPVYYFGILAVSFIIIAPYMSLPEWESNFHPPLQHRVINPVWFSAFQVIGAWANTGRATSVQSGNTWISLVDQNVVPFQTAYIFILVLVFCVLAGNTCLPVFWTLWKLPGPARYKEALHFLLDHPRRCTIYLFPARQTWLLIGTIMVLNLTNLLFDLVLNIGNPATEALPFGVRFIDAVLLAAACRNAGYQPVSVAALVPAVQVLFVVMMYIAIYPIAMSVRATNVYEQKSLGVYEQVPEDDEIDDDEHWNRPTESRVAIWGKYLLRHARRQLSFVFELVSAYGTENFALSGGMHVLSKLVVCAVMIRGRHRGLPVALDRAVLFPSDFLPTRATGPSEPEKPPVAAEEAEAEVEAGEVVGPLRDAPALAAKMRMRARTVSLVVAEERRAPGAGAGVNVPDPGGVARADGGVSVGSV
ncbi:TrkH-domain-containing protein [Epithele typhae]|uniref:TrkH-domain-containing protein n=1 Tax=Epithele typhae TaxID=378194 RepID=UPI0020087968|nr:TrkH-domain-containing protein [Epithele typhae]KAH9932738.1 TrkH-domain-containing protein [Epithele typhae]